jgi:NitT/TauT family transport system substrate-binding protein
MEVAMTTSAKMFRFSIGAVAGMLLGLAGATTAFAADKVTMAHAGTQLMRLPLYIAIQNGYFKDEGLDLEIVETRSGSDGMKMLAGSAVNFAAGQLLDAINLNNQQVDTKGVVMLTQRLTNSIVVRKASADKIKSMKDLKGQTVGVTSVGSGTWQFAVFAGTLEGMKADDFNFIAVGAGASVIGAIKAGRIEAMSYSDPENLQMVKDGDAVFLIDMADNATHKRILGDSYLNNQIMVLDKYAKSNPKQVQGLANAIQRAVVWVNTHSVEETAKVLHSYPAFSALKYEEFLVSVKRTLPDGMAKTAAISKEAFDSAMRLPVAVGAVPAAMAYEKLVDRSFTDNAIKKYPPAN